MSGGVEETTPVLVPVPTPQSSLADETSLHLTPLKKEQPRNTTKVIECSLAENQHEKKVLRQKLGFLENQLQQEAQTKASVSPSEKIFSELPSTNVEQPPQPTTLPDLPPRAPPPADIHEVYPKPEINIAVDPPHLPEFADPPHVSDHRHFLRKQLRDLGVY